MTDQLREKDRVVLQAVSDGHDDTQKIKSQTILETHEIRYSLEKLEETRLVELEKPDGMVERTVNGQKRVFKAPTHAKITKEGKDQVSDFDSEPSNRYEELTHTELVEKVHRLESQLEKLQQKFDTFQRQVKQRLE